MREGGEEVLGGQEVEAVVVKHELIKDTPVDLCVARFVRLLAVLLMLMRCVVFGAAAARRVRVAKGVEENACVGFVRRFVLLFGKRALSYARCCCCC